MYNYDIECELDCMYLRQIIRGAVRVVTNKQGPFGYIVYMERETKEEMLESYKGHPIFYRIA